MAESTPITQPAEGDDTFDIATDEIAGIRYQRVKAGFGEDGEYSDVSASSPLPVAASALPLPDGAATQATLAAVLAAMGPLATDAGLAAILSKLSSDPATQTTLAAIFARVPALGQALAAGSVPVVLTAAQIASLMAPVLASGENFVGLCGRGGTIVTGTTSTTDTTLLTIGDAVGSLITFTDIARANGKSFWIVGVKISAAKVSIVPQLRLHLFNANDATLSANNVAFQTKVADFDKRIRSIDIPALATPADTSNSNESRIDFTPFPVLCFPAPGSRSIYGALELVSGAYTPTNPVNFSVSLIVEWN